MLKFSVFLLFTLISMGFGENRSLKVTQPPPIAGPAAITACYRSLTPPSTAVLVFPGNATYDFLRRGNDGMSMLFFPAVVVNVTSVKDVQDSVQCAIKLNIEINVQGGGHSYMAAFTTSGIMLNTNLFNQPFTYGGVTPYDLTSYTDSFIYTSAGSKSAHAHGMLLYLSQSSPLPAGKNSFVISSGTHPNVGLAGHTMCGGYGDYGRLIGLASDQVLEFTYVDANANVLVANNVTNTETFWAMRGGCGTAFGIVVGIKFHVTYVNTVGVAQAAGVHGVVTHVSYKVPAGLEAQVMYWVQSYSPYAPAEATLVYDIQTLSVSAIYFGNKQQAIDALWTDVGFKACAKILGLPAGPTPTLSFQEMPQFDSMQIEFGLNMTEMIAVNYNPAEGVGSYYSTSFFQVMPMPLDVVTRLVNYYLPGTETAIFSSLGYKAHNGPNSLIADDLQPYVNDQYGCMVRGSLGIWQVTFGTRNISLNAFTQVASTFEPYITMRGGYVGYPLFEPSIYPAGIKYYTEAGVARLQALRMKTDPNNVFRSRNAYYLYPVASDPDYSSSLPLVLDPNYGPGLPSFVNPYLPSANKPTSVFAGVTNGNALSTGALAGLIVGIAALVAISIILVVRHLKTKATKEEKKEADDLFPKNVEKPKSTTSNLKKRNTTPKA